MTPVTQANLALPDVQLPSAVQVGLAGFDSPLSELIGTFSSFNQWMFSSDNTTAGYTDLGGLADATGVAIAKMGFNFSSVGLLPQVINDHMPILSQVGLNGAESLGSTMNSLATMGLIASEAVWNLPGAFVTATQQALSGDIPGAIATLQAAIVTPFVDAGQVALANGNFLLDNAVARGTALLSAVPTLVNLVVQSSVGQATVLAGAFSTVVQNVITGITNGNAEEAWNAAVDGFLGPNGIPGTFLNLTVGAGVQTGAATVVPSIRGEIQAAVHGIADALSQTGSAPPVPPPAAAASPSASALRTAAAVESSPADEGGATASNENSGGGNGASAGEKSGGSHSKAGSAKSGAKHGVAGSKRAAKASSGSE
ncbi:hypothetical protein FHT40_005563 [Mycolicibacterium sp. BK556]|uniref:hypothetical protein n=1 Tax=Mycobacteriaceae TaxID=1762 RepID=UPI00105EA17E|nr:MULTISPECIES: hypothetical protein [Mycobacteriaceae]MBB3605876.1 hypothetical protein [Mycolicibacterium sp. BK556]MBB3635627.1 hypothetical protein [Mycolicibacterium sp. BK607]MBB3753045.1 hypothetical protein [Mycolicibacterium sp. BK634]